MVYGAPEGALCVDVRLDRETVWLTQRQMADVFETSTDNVSLHLRNVFADGELEETATTEDFSVVRSEGGRQLRRCIRHYDLDAVISVGYRVRSRQAVRFRQWATRTLREHLLYLEQEGMEHGLNPQAPTALTLLIAESAPHSKDLMIRLVVNLLAGPTA